MSSTGNPPGRVVLDQFVSGLIMPLMMLIGNLNYVVVAVLGGLRVATGRHRCRSFHIRGLPRRSVHSRVTPTPLWAT